MSNKTIGSFVVATIAGFAIQSCFSTSPPPQCQAQSGLNYIASFKKVGGACTPGDDIKGMKLGMQEFLPPQTGAASLGVKVERLFDNAQDISANLDPANDCHANAEGGKASCEYCAATNEVEKDGEITYVPILVNDAGVTRDGGTQFPDGGRISLANFCEPIKESFERIDPTDEEKAGVIAVGKFPRAPANGVCIASDFTGGSQNYVAFTAPNKFDGGVFSVPALSQKYEWSNFVVVTTAVFPGTAFTAKLKYTEDGCTTDYEVRGIAPAVACKADEDCNPNANLDAGRVTGSGINPEFKPKCVVDLGYCLPTVDFTNPKLPPRDPLQ